MTKRSKSEAAPHVLLAVDGSEHSLAALSMLRELSLPPEAHVTAIAVLIPREAGVKYSFLHNVLEHTRALLAGRGLRADAELLAGYPAEQIMAFAERAQPTLIVLGAKGLRATMGILLGGVAQQVVEYASCPVLIVRAPYAGLRRALVAVDGSAHSLQATAYVARLALPQSTEVHVAHVLPPALTAPPAGPDWGTGVAVPTPSPEQVREADSQQAQEEREGQARLAEALTSLRAAGREPIIALLRGDAATEIMAYVKAHEVELVVAGARGQSTMRSAHLGSVARKLLHYGGCSVLIVKEPAEAQAA